MREAEQGKAFRGTTTREVMRLIKQELGDEAIILSNRVIRRQGLRPTVEIIARPADAAAAARALPGGRPRADLDRLREAFDLNDVPAALAERLLRLYSYRAAETAQAPMEVLADTIGLIQLFAPSFSAGVPAGTPVALVGPTGVGKTTTIAKLATLDRLHGRSVGLITIDTFRVGAVEQLSRYATLLNTTLLTASTPEELSAAIAHFSQMDRIYIDTAGSGPWEEERLQELCRILDCHTGIKRMLLLPASGNSRDLAQVVSRFRQAQPSLLSITKIDETCCFGPCFGQIVESGLPLMFFGTGPQVPDHLEQAGAARIAAMLARVRH